jgi:cbb3-type cytochrome oxidase maturation protein
MTILLVLIPLGIVLLIVALAAFVWAVRSGQFEDLEGEGERILFDDEPLAAPRTPVSNDLTKGPES